MVVVKAFSGNIFCYSIIWIILMMEVEEIFHVDFLLIDFLDVYGKKFLRVEFLVIIKQFSWASNRLEIRRMCLRM